MSNLFLVRYPDEPICVSQNGNITIGRSDKNDIVLTEPRVSRKHAVIEWLEPTDVYVICDTGSSNGTYLNNNKLPVHHPGFLNDRDKIRIASAVFTVRIVDDPSVIKNEFKQLRSRVVADVTEVVNLTELLSEQQSGFSGKLEHLCPVELFQILETGYKSGILTIKTADGDGSFTISNGQVASALIKGIEGGEAVYEALKYTEGMFNFKPQDVAIEKNQIPLNITSLLMEGCRRLDESSIVGS